jgi:hypothetical protein
LAGKKNSETPAVNLATAEQDTTIGAGKPSDVRIKAATSDSGAARITVDSAATVTQSIDSLVSTNEPSKGAL